MHQAFDVADGLANLAGERAPVEVMVAQDEVDRPLGEGHQRGQGGTQDVTLGNVAGDEQRIGLFLDGSAKPRHADSPA